MSADFLHDPGTSGFIATPFALFTAADTGLNALTNGSVVTSAHGGTSGVFSQTNSANAQLCEIWFNVVTTGWTPTVGGCIAGWFLMSTDGGTTFEALAPSPSVIVPAVPRAPDFIIPFEGEAVSAGAVKFAQGPVPLPWTSCKVTIQNFTGATLGAGAHTIYCGPVADKY